MSILGFKKGELRAVVIIFILLFTAIFFNLQVSFRKSRDERRKGDIRAIYDALVYYHEDSSSFPASSEGRIVACLGGFDENNVPQRKECEWGWEGLTDIFAEESKEYIHTLPTDPYHNDGARYLYLSNGRTFQLYASLEGESEPEFDPAVVKRNLNCGNKICNYGLAFNDTPLDKSIEEYENEKRKNK